MSRKLDVGDEVLIQTGLACWADMIHSWAAFMTNYLD
jgi:hypothetical protein